jgi:hypothetical protein
MYILTTGVVGIIAPFKFWLSRANTRWLKRADGRPIDLVQAVNDYRDAMKQRSISSAGMNRWVAAKEVGSDKSTIAVIAFEIIQIGRSYPARQELGKLDVKYGSGGFLDVSSGEKLPIFMTVWPCALRKPQRPALKTATARKKDGILPIQPFLYVWQRMSLP